MSKLEKAKEIIKENISDADCGIYNCRGCMGDRMTNIHNEDGLCIDICYGYAYFEVFGLSVAEFEELQKYYEEIRG